MSVGHVFLEGAKGDRRGARFGILGSREGGIGEWFRGPAAPPSLGTPRDIGHIRWVPSPL